MGLLFRIARTRLGRFLTGRLFARMSSVLPLNRLHETDTLVAFHHPKPSYPVHVLLVPQKNIGGLTDLTPADTAFLSDLFQTVRTLVAELELEATGYRLVANDGPYQDVPLWHFHLISG